MLTGQILLQLVVILIVVQVFGYLCRRIGQQWVIGEIIAGLVLGPSFLGMFLPGVKSFIFPVTTLPTLQTLGDIGLVLYMFSLGARLDTHLMLRQSRIAIATSISGIILPLIIGVLLAYFLFPTLGGPKATLLSFTLLVGTSMAITAFPVLARFLAEKNMLSTKVGILALTCAAIDDVVAWCLLALVITVAHSQSPLSIATTLGCIFLFIACMFLLVRPLLNYGVRFIRSKQILMAMSICLLLLAAYTTNAIGIHPIFGAFLMGIVLPRKAFFVEFVRDIDRMNSLLFLPLFFVYSGLQTHLGLISTLWLWCICLLVLLSACAGKILGGTSAVRLMGKSWHEAFSLGILMNTRGLVELIVLNIGLQLGILSPTLFAMLVIMALVTTMMASPLLAFLGYKQTRSQDAVEEKQYDSSHS